MGAEVPAAGGRGRPGAARLLPDPHGRGEVLPGGRRGRPGTGRRVPGHPRGTLRLRRGDPRQRGGELLQPGPAQHAPGLREPAGGRPSDPRGNERVRRRGLPGHPARGSPAAHAARSRGVPRGRRGRGGPGGLPGAAGPPDPRRLASPGRAARSGPARQRGPLPEPAAALGRQPVGPAENRGRRCSSRDSVRRKNPRRCC